MRNLTRLISAFIMALFMLPATISAQQAMVIPADDAVRVGTLPNGLTYYIRHNEYPKGQADFYIAQKVGSILEDDNQRGLAHFLEHMCFNGTTHYPGKNLINWLESVGVKFGQNLNAATGMDMTIYNISNVPVAREGVQDSCLLILHDWANDLLLLPEEIDAERGVIHEEWRSSMVGQMRILENILPIIYPDSPYGHRLPIGTMEVVDNFPYQALRDYYEKWYRPDLQGVIVVGDIDVDRIEAKIKEMFADIEMPQNAAERIYFPIADNPGTIYAIGHDKEQKRNQAQLMFKHEALPRELRATNQYFVINYLGDMISQMLGTRLHDIASKPDAPFTAAGASDGNFFWSPTKGALSLFTLASDSNLPASMAAAYRELLRAARHGFTPSEYERAKAEYISRYENAYNNRNERTNETYVNQYVDNFLEGTAMPSLETEFQIAQQLAAGIPVELVNQYLASLVKPENRVLMALMPDNDANIYPTEQQFADALAAVDAEDIEAYKEEMRTDPLIPQLPTPGSIISTSTLPAFEGVTEFKLSNGATILVKPTKFKSDEILVAAYAPDGTASINDKSVNSLLFLNAATSRFGLGEYSNLDLSKYLQGKQVSFSPRFGQLSRSFSGFSTIKDLPTLMELIYMNFTAPNLTDDEFEAFRKLQISLISNQESDPQYIFSKKVLSTLYNSPRIRQLDTEVINGANRAEIVDIARTLTANAADYTFIFVGNIDLETFRPLVEQYIASLPGNPATAVTKAPLTTEFDMIGGKKTDTFTTKMQNPQTWVYITAFGNEPYTMANQQLSSIAGQILSKRLLDIVREDEGAVYSIGAQGQMDRIGNQNTTLLTAFPMKPELKDKVLDIIANQFTRLGNEISQEELDKVKEYMVKNYTEGKELNNSWLAALTGYTTNGVDTFNGNIQSINDLTTDDVKRFVNNLLQQNNYRVVILDPQAN